MVPARRASLATLIQRQVQARYERLADPASLRQPVNKNAAGGAIDLREAFGRGCWLGRLQCNLSIHRVTSEPDPWRDRALEFPGSSKQVRIFAAGAG